MPTETKNWEMIEKLIRLANNNPNENEANLAARKACSLLENVRFKTKAPVGQGPGPRTSPTGRHTYSGRYDSMWDEVFRNSDAFWKEKEREEKVKKERAEEFNKRREAEEKARTEQEKKWEESAKKNFIDFEDLLGKKINWSKVSESPFYEEYSRKTRSDTPKIMKCVKCGKEQETRYMGNPGSFRCFGCWSK